MAPPAPTLLSSVKCFGGEHRRYSHPSPCCGGCTMTFAVYLPPNALRGGGASPAPCVWYLSGLTCTDANAAEKAGLQRTASALGLALLFPDTSPRGLAVPGEAEHWDFGLGAGFYVDATQPPWSAGYRMWSYVSDELPSLLASPPFAALLDTRRAAVMGHSMGGHGALTLALTFPGRYRSASAFAPICHPSACPWGQKALGRYLGPDRASWDRHDAVALLRAYPKDGARLPVLIDQGSADSNLESQLKPGDLAAAAEAAGYPVTLRMQEGYDHSFVSSFAEDHLRHHAAALAA